MAACDARVLAWADALGCARVLTVSLTGRVALSGRAAPRQRAPVQVVRAQAGRPRGEPRRLPRGQLLAQRGKQRVGGVGGGPGGGRGVQREHEFAAQPVGMPAQPARKRCGARAVHLLEAFGEFAPDDDHPLRLEHGGQVVGGVQDPVRALVEHHDRLGVRERGQPRSARRRPRGQEALEHEARAREPGDRQQRGHRRRSGHRHHRQAGLVHRSHHVRARIADARRARVAHQRDAASGADAIDDPPRHFALVVRVRRQQLGRTCAGVGEQHPGDARVLGGHRVGLTEYVDRGVA